MANSSSVYDWFQERLEIQDITDDVTSKYVPPHVNIFYCLGGITLVCFLIQFATGFAMTFYYKPTVTQDHNGNLKFKSKVDEAIYNLKKGKR